MKNTKKESLILDNNTVFVFIVSVCLIAISLVFIWNISFLLYNINVGFDITDHGYYLINLHQPERLFLNVVQFGHVWKGFFGENNIVIDRFIIIFLVVLSGIFLCSVIYFRFFNKLNYYLFPIWILSGALVSLNVFHWFILTPNYNNMALVFLNIIVALYFMMQKDSGKVVSRRRLVVVFFGIGFFYSALIFSRVPSAFLVGLVFLVSITVTLPQIYRPRNIIPVICSGLLGVAAFGLLVTVRSASILDVVVSMWDGYFLLKVTGTHPVTVMWTWTLFYDFFFKSGSYILIHGTEFQFQAIAGAVIVVMSLGRSRTKSNSTSLAKYVTFPSWSAGAFDILPSMLLILFAALEVQALVTSPDLHRHLLTIYWLGAILASLSFIVRWISYSWDHRFFGATIFLLAIPIIGSFGSNNGFYLMIAFYAGFPALLLLLSGLAAPERVLPPVVAMGVILVLSVAYCGVTLMQERPYRLFGTLADATVVSSVAGTEGMRLTPATARVLDAAREHVYQGETAKRPVIIDTSGRVPVLVEHLNGRSPAAPWISIFANPLVSEVVFGLIERPELASAWIIVSETDRPGSKVVSQHFENLTQRLRELGLDFEIDFERVATFTLPVIYGSGDRVSEQVDLFKPRVNR